MASIDHQITRPRGKDHPESVLSTIANRSDPAFVGTPYNAPTSICQGVFVRQSPQGVAVIACVIHSVPIGHLARCRRFPA